ncbi:LysR family transcriptional regulator [Sphaerotilus uruguayifluvii]|uniref:LysR family glycine cleavage system transcriptional activator n=1 Tax=Sphaerotilus uruguayifluvii TaxID=2735897 RepID=A0ABX2G4Z8_9BURK|nr:LysR family transcriptional regulator [Leptothrix sp. C29]NRT57406.1 LysR family glycine cleavage system transcriptional activator [Leptothrix sp. C29]
MNRLPRRPLPLDCLRTFEAVARLLSFSAAAEELNLTQPAISRQIKGLEEELGAPLFLRATRRVELTGAGQTLLRAVEPALARIDASVRQIRLSRSRAMVSVTTFPSFASLWLMPRLPDFERDHPLADIRIAATDRMIETDDAELDVALRHCDASKAPDGAVRLFGELLTPVIGARLADAIERGSAPPLRRPADLTDHTLLEMDDGLPGSLATCWPVWLAAQGLGQLAPRRWISVNYTHQQVQAALAGQGVALARLAMVHDVVERGDLVEPFGVQGRLWASPCYWLVPLGGARAVRRPEVQAFCDWVLAQAALTRRAVGDIADPEAEVLPD